MGDISIIKEWEKAIKRTPYLRVFIWSLDKHLMGYDYQPCDRVLIRVFGPGLLADCHRRGVSGAEPENQFRPGVGVSQCAAAARLFRFQTIA